MQVRCCRQAMAAIILLSGWAANPTRGAVVQDVPHSTTAGSAGSAAQAPLPADSDLSPRAREVDASRLPSATTLTPVGARAPRVGRQLPGGATEVPLPRTGQPALADLNPADADAQIGPAPQVVDVAPIPEPSTGVLLCAAGLVALTRRGKRRPLHPKTTANTSNRSR